MQKNPKKPARSIYFALLFLCMAAYFSNASAQGYFFWNPADHSLPFSSEINPALLSNHFTQVAAGLQVFHLGFLEDNDFSLRENRVNLSFPYILPFDFAIGFDVRYYSAMVYSELAASLLLSRKISTHFSLGVKIALERRGFDRAKFQGVDFSDPLISSGLSFNRFNFGLGAFWQKESFTLGLALDHVNQPGIGIVDQSATVPMELSGAFGYRIGAITPMVLLHEDGNQLRAGLAIVAQKSTLGSLRIGYEDRLPFRLEASLNLSKNSSLGYGIDLPKAGTRGLSSGSHQFVYKHILGREPELGQPEILFSTRRLNILEKTVIRSLPADLQLDNLSAIDEILPDYLSSARTTDDLMIIVAGALSDYETKTGTLERYKRISKKVRNVFSRNPGVRVILRADESTLQDAAKLKYYISQQLPQATKRLQIARINTTGLPSLHGFIPGRVTIARMKPAFSAEKVIIELPAPGNTRKTRGWELTIQAAGGRVIKTFSGRKKLPSQIEWDWRDHRGKTVRPGLYTCQLTARTIYNNDRNAKAGPLTVVLVKRKVKIKFGKEPNQQTTRSTPAKQAVGMSK